MINKYIFAAVTSIFTLFLLSGCYAEKAGCPDAKTACSGCPIPIPPLTAPGSYSIAGDKDFVTIPFELYTGTKPLIRGTMNGKNVSFLIDNGKMWDEVWFYNGEVDSIGLTYKNSESISLTGVGEDGASSIIEGNDVDITFGDITFTEQPALISPPEADFDAYFPGINGQVCAPLFKNFIVTFNFDNNTITLTKPDKFAYPADDMAIPMERRENGSYCVPFTLHPWDSQIRWLSLDIDIGTVVPLYLIANKRNGLIIPANTEKKLMGYGASGAVYSYSDTIKTVQIGNNTLHNVPAELVESGANADSTIVESGTFGVPFMKKFNITFDYFHQRIYFEPNKSFAEPFK